MIWEFHIVRFGKMYKNQITAIYHVMGWNNNNKCFSITILIAGLIQLWLNIYCLSRGFHTLLTIWREKKNGATIFAIDKPNREKYLLKTPVCARYYGNRKQTFHWRISDCLFYCWIKLFDVFKWNLVDVQNSYYYINR